MTTAAVYCRVSTEDQEREGSSLSSQNSYCLRKAAELGYDVPADCIFTEVFSGADTDRPRLNEMRRLIRSHSVDAVICYSTDRLARNPIHIAIIAEECEKRGIELVFVSEPLDSTPEGALVRYIKGYAAQVEREKIRERSLRGKREKAMQGKLSTGGRRLFGYDVVEGRRVINDTEAEVIRRIFNWFAECRYTLYKAVRDLNSERIPGPAGGKWKEVTIYRLLNHPAYYGVTYAFRYKCVEPKRSKFPKGTKSARILRDKSEWIEVPGATPPIISKNIFEAAQEQLVINRHKSPFTLRQKYLFSGGRLRCGTCGRSMTGGTNKKAGKVYHFYRCICNVKPNYYGKCSQPSISASKVEPLVWGEILNILDNPDMLIENIKSRRSQSPTSIEAEEFLLNNNIKKAREEETRYIELYGKGRISEVSFEKLIEKIRGAIQVQEKKLRALRGKRQSFEQAEAHIEDLVKTSAIFSKVLKNADFELKAKAMEALDIQVTYLPDKTVLITGILPMGATNFHMPRHTQSRNTPRFEISAIVK